ncbi:MAG: hypothetical protein UW23_C0019G0040, partial [Candidatus Collierbacteria bacterium GW2011_GWA1_44_12]
MPVMVPMRRAREKYFVDWPPKRNIARSMKMMVSELLRERAMVSVTAR